MQQKLTPVCLEDIFLYFDQFEKSLHGPVEPINCNKVDYDPNFNPSIRGLS